jgi:hypothetical protein
MMYILLFLVFMLLGHDSPHSEAPAAAKATGLAARIDEQIVRAAFDTLLSTSHQRSHSCSC